MFRFDFHNHSKFRYKYWKVKESICYSKCGWSPMNEHTFKWKVRSTFVNGKLAFDNNEIKEDVRGKALVFDN